MPNPSQEPPASSKAPNEDLKDMDVLCTFKIKIESQNSEHRCIKDQWPYPNQDEYSKSQSGASSVLQGSNEDLKDMGVLCTLKIKTEGQNPENGGSKYLWLFQNQDNDVKPQSETT